MRGLSLLVFTLFLALADAPAQASNSFESVRFLREVRANLSLPVDVALAENGEILLLDQKTLQVKVYDKSGGFLRQFGGKASMKKPVALAVGSGMIVVADAGLKKVLVFDEQGTLLTEFGGSGKAPGQFSKLRDVEVDRFGSIYTADAGNSTISRFSNRGILMSQARFGSQVPQDIALASDGFVYVLMDRSSEVYRLKLDGSTQRRMRVSFSTAPSSAAGLFVDSRGDLYLTQYKKNNVAKYDLEGNLLASFGSRGKGPGAFNKPTRLDGNAQGELYILDSNNKRAQGFQLQGNDKQTLMVATHTPPLVSLIGKEPIKEPLSAILWRSDDLHLRLHGTSGRILSKGLQTTVIGKTGKKPGEFRKPSGMAVLADGRIVVADTDNNRVQILATSGRTVVFGERGSEPGFFRSPTDVAINSEGMIYVADSGNARVQIFTDQGIFLHSFGHAGKSKKGEPASSNSFQGPLVLAIDSADRVHVLDIGNARIATFSARGEPMRVIEGFTQSVDIALDPLDNLYIADNSCHCVRVIDTSGKQLVQFGSLGQGDGQLGDMTAIAASDNKVFVADATHRRLKTFSLNLGGILLEERLKITQNFFVPIESLEDKALLRRYRILALEKAAEKLAAMAGISATAAYKQIRVDKEKTLPGGEIQMVVSMQKPAPMLNTAPPAVKDMLFDSATEEETLELTY